MSCSHLVLLCALLAHQVAAGAGPAGTKLQAHRALPSNCRRRHLQHPQQICALSCILPLPRKRDGLPALAAGCLWVGTGCDQRCSGCCCRLAVCVVLNGTVQGLVAVYVFAAHVAASCHQRWDGCRCHCRIAVLSYIVLQGPESRGLVVRREECKPCCPGLVSQHSTPERSTAWHAAHI